MKMINRITNLAVVLLSLLAVSSLKAEIFTETYTPTPCQDATLITEMLIGPGVALHPSGKILKPTADVQIGVYSNLVVREEPRLVPFTNGVIISTGKIDQGPSLINEEVAYYWGEDEALVDLDDGDPDMNEYFNEYTLANTAGIVLYIQPKNRTINIPFVMASEEFYYQTYEPYLPDLPDQDYYDQYSDKFAFFIKEIADASTASADYTNDVTRMTNNIAKLREGGGDIEISSVNQHTNTEFFIQNVVTNSDGELEFPALDIKLPMEFNGAIIGPVATIGDLDTNKIYKLKIAIADANRYGYDNYVNSVVFLRARGITSGADLKVDVSGPTSMAAPGNATFTDTVSNVGPATADDVTVKHYLPFGVDTSTVSINCGVGSVDPASWGTIGGTNYFVWSVGSNFVSGSNATMTVTCELPKKGTYTNCVEVATSTGDYNPDNDKDDLVTVVGDLPRLRVEAITTNKTYGATLSLADLQFVLSIDGTNETQITTGIDVAFTDEQGHPAYPTNATAAVGTYNIVLSNIRGFDLSTFGDRITYVPGTLTIDKAELKITANNLTKAYGENLVLIGTEFTSIGLMNGETISRVNVTSKTGKAADVTAAVKTYEDELEPSHPVMGIDTNNYTIAFEPGDLTVTQRCVTVTAPTRTRAPGEPNPTDAELTAGCTLSESLIDGNALVYNATCTYTGDVPGTHAGVITVTGETSQGNYRVAYVNGDLKITDPIPLKIYVADTSVVYGADVPTDLGFKTSAARYDRTDVDESKIFGLDDVTFATTYTKNAAVGGYTINTNSADLSSVYYLLEVVPGTLTVTQKCVTVTAPSKTRAPGEPNPTDAELTAGCTVSEELLPGNALTYNATCTYTGDVPGTHAGVITVTGAASQGNYTVAYVNGTLTITEPIPLKIYVADTNVVYGADVPTGFGFKTGAERYDRTDVDESKIFGLSDVTFATTYTKNAAVGDYTINTNSPALSSVYYLLEVVPGTLTVTQKCVTVTAPSPTRAPGAPNPTDAELTAGCTLSEPLIAGNTLAYNATCTYTGDEPGTHTGVITVTGDEEQGNYRVVYVPGNLTITDRVPLKIYVADTNVVYGTDVPTGFGFKTGTARYDRTDVDESKIFGLSDVTFATTYTKNAAVGDYEINTNSAALSSVYYILEVVPGTLTVDKAVLTIKADNATKKYGEELTFDGTEFTATGLVGSDVVTSVTLTCEGTAASAAYKAEGYPIVPSAAAGTGLGNYEIGYQNGTLSLDKLAIEIMALNGEKEYGQSYPFLGDEFTITAGALMPGDSVDSVTLVSDGAPATAPWKDGGYPIVPSAAQGTGLGGYAITYKNGTLMINKRTLTITAKDTDKTYGETVVFEGTEFMASGLLDGDSVSAVALSSEGAPAAAACKEDGYPIVPSAAEGSGLDSYAISYVSGTLTVRKSELIITANDVSKTYGEALAFDGTEFTTQPVILPNGERIETVTIASEEAATIDTPAGTYQDSIVPSHEVVGIDTNNYDIVFSNGTLTVQQVVGQITITASSAKKKYDGTPLSSAGYTYTDGILVAGDVLTATVEGSITNVGTAANVITSHRVMRGLMDVTSCYVFTDPVAGRLEVTMRELVLSAASDSKTYDGTPLTNDGYTVSGDGLAGGEELVVTVEGSITDAGVATNKITSYQVKRGLADLTENYAFGDCTDGTLTVKPRRVVLTSASDSKIYDGTPLRNAVVTISGESFVGSEGVNCTVTGEQLAVGVSKNDFTFALTGGAKEGNYVIEQALGNLTVTKRSVTVTANDMTKGYGTIHLFAGTEFTVEGLVLGDEIESVTFLSDKAAAPSTPIGEYQREIAPFHPVTGIDTNLYELTFISGKLSVTQAVLTVVANDAIWKVGKPRPSYSFADFSGQLVAGDTISGVTGGLGTAEDLIYTNRIWTTAEPTVVDKDKVFEDEIWIDRSSLDGERAANYAIEIVPGDLTIVKADPEFKTVITAVQNWDTGLLDLELTITNVGDGEVEDSADYWVELTHGPEASGMIASVNRTYYLDSPTGTLQSGADYVELTDAVKAALRGTGNVDEAFDPGETIVIKGVSVYHWKRWSPDKFINADTFFTAGTLDRRQLSTCVDPITEGTPASMAVETAVESVSAQELESVAVAGVYDGVLLQADGEPLGLIQVKLGKVNKKTGLSRLKATIQIVGEKSIVAAGDFDPDTYVFTAEVGGKYLELHIGKNVLSGSLADLERTGQRVTIEGARNRYKSKTAEDLAVVAAADTWIGAYALANPTEIGWDTYQVAIQKRGQVRLVGSLANGSKVSIKAQMICGTACCLVPVIATEKGAPLAFCIKLDENGARVVGLAGAVFGPAGGLDAHGAFRVDREDVVALFGNETVHVLDDYLPIDADILMGGVKWVVVPNEQGKPMKSGKLFWDKVNHQVDFGRSQIAGFNVSGLKLTYLAKKGTFNGSFKIYTVESDVLRTTNVSVAGVVVSGVGYGTARVGKSGSVAIGIR